MIKKYDILYLSDKAIGNTLEMLYAIEYCLENNIKASIYIENVNKSFLNYLQNCYGKDVVLSSIDNIEVTNLVHTFIVNKKVNIKYDNYIYINPDHLSTKYQSETEQYLSVVKALYPSNYDSPILSKLIGKETQRIKNLNIQNKVVIYSGCSSFAAVRRWPYYMELIKKLGEENIIVVGGNDDLVNDYAYIYKNFISKVTPYQLTNRKSFWNLCKKLHLLQPYAHNKDIANLKNSYFNIFSWEELVYIFKNAKVFIGNDGGLMHLASASGAKGIAIFGATSVAKSKSYNPKIKELYTNYDCQPCHFGVGKVYINNYFISCPYQVKCLHNISVEQVLEEIGKL